MGLSSSCGIVKSDDSWSGVTEMAIIQPAIVHPIADHSCLDGRSNKITLVTSKLIMIDADPNTPTVDGGNHVNARKSSVEAATERNIATIKSGLRNTDCVNGADLFCVRERGS